MGHIVKLHYAVKRSFLPSNKKGRDFVLGDLHGCYQALMRLLRAVNFSPKIDRLFSVGDLIDRGPSSSRCLRLINRSWFHGVLGNHDIAFVINNGKPQRLDFAETEYYAAVAQSGGQWYTTPPFSDFSATCEKLNKMPHIITVGVKKPEYHIVHACLHPFRGITPSLYSDADIELYEVPPQRPLNMIHSLTSERELWTTYHPPGSKGLALTICGHTLVPEAMWSLGHLNIDTGAGYRGSERRLTMACITTKKLWSVPTDKSGRVTCRPFPKKHSGSPR